MTVISGFKRLLEATIHIEGRRRLHWFVGLRIRREKGKVKVDPERYRETMLERFQMDQCKPSRTPAVLNLILQTPQNGDEEVDQRIWRSLAGSLVYLIKQTSQDIMFTVNILSRHMNVSTNQQWLCGKRLQYLQGSKASEITYTNETSYDLVGKVMQTGLVMWKTENKWRAITSRLTDVAQHSAGHSCSFFIRGRISGMAVAVEEAFYLKQLLEGLGMQNKHPIAIVEDNQSCMKLWQNPVMHKRSKHIEKNFTLFGTRRKMGLFQFVTFLLTKWQPTSSQIPYPYRRWKHSELFWWEQNLRSQLKSEWGC